MKCKYFKNCGGCEGNFDGIADELIAKTESIKSLFGGLNATVHDCYGTYYPFRYRNKVHLAFGSLKGKTIIGFYEEGSTKITDVDSCVLFGDWLNKLILVLREFVSRFKVYPFDKFTGNGILRYAHARCVDDKLQLTLVVTTENFGGRDWLYKKLLEHFGSVSLYLNINRRTDHAVLGTNFKFCKGEKYLNFEMLNVKVSLSAGSFLQVNLLVAKEMYKKAIELLNIDKNTTVIDLYSGVGITSILFGRIAKDVVSIEEVPSAIENAKFMTKLNDVHNVNIFQGKCEDVLPRVKKSGRMVVFTDPARLGMERGVITEILNFSPETIVYMSCNPETCVRDIKMLVSDNNYTLTDIFPYNMFPLTKHTELLCVLQKSKD